MSNRPTQLPQTKLSSLADQVYEFIHNGIIRGELKPGEKLVELDIAAQMGSSQGPVREALQRLERDGLVERRARSATFVTNILLDETYEMFSIRSVIEGLAVRRTATKITESQCDNLVALIDRMAEAGGEKDIITLSNYDIQFHRRIVEWSGSAGLLRMWMPLSSQIQRWIIHSHPTHYPDLVTVGTRHQPIIDALRQHNADQAVRELQDHIMLIWLEIEPSK